MCRVTKGAKGVMIRTAELTASEQFGHAGKQDTNRTNRTIINSDIERM